METELIFKPFDPFDFMSDDELIDYLANLYFEEEEAVFNRACELAVTFEV